jgi:integration host factor subunit beta
MVGMTGRNTVSAMTKSDLIDRVADLKKLSKARAETLVNQVFDCVEEALRRDERVEIRGIGSFEIRRYGAYKGRNPRTGEAVAVKPKRLPFFKVGKGLKDLINTSVGQTQETPDPGAASGKTPAEVKSRIA